MATRAAPITDAETVDYYLDVLSELVDEIPLAAEDWDQETATLEFEMTWWSKMWMFHCLYLTCQASLMTAGQRQRFRDVVRRFHENLHLVRQMRLAEPPFSLEEVLKEAA